jgi:hypothetical protein
MDISKFGNRFEVNFAFTALSAEVHAQTWLTFMHVLLDSALLLLSLHVAEFGIPVHTSLNDTCAPGFP